MKAPVLLAISIFLYVGAIVWGLVQGPGTFLAGLLAGCGSIAMGVWMGLELTLHPELMTKAIKDATLESDAEDLE